MSRCVWRLSAQAPPKLIRRWRRCDRERLYVTTGAFRVNANGRRIDAWLLYRCAQCGDTWKARVIQRRNRRAIDTSIYDALLRNDPILARAVAFEVAGREPAQAPPVQVTQTATIDRRRAFSIELVLDDPVSIRRDALLANQLGLPRSSIRHMAQAARIEPADWRWLRRAARSGDVIRILPPQ